MSVETVCLCSTNEEFGEVPLWLSEVLALFLSGEPFVHWMSVVTLDIQLTKDDSLEAVGMSEFDNFVFRIGLLTAELVAWCKHDVGRWIRVLKFYKRFVGGIS